MHEELVRVRKDYAESMQILEAKWKEERKEYEEEKQHLKERHDKIQD